MAIPFYYNPATNELELTADPSPLRDSLGKRFGLDEISIARNTLSPTKSYAEKPQGWEKTLDPAPWDEAAEGGRIGFSRGNLITQGPKTGKYYFTFGGGDNFESYYADSSKEGKAWVERKNIESKKSYAKKVSEEAQKKALKKGITFDDVKTRTLEIIKEGKLGKEEITATLQEEGYIKSSKNITTHGTFLNKLYDSLAKEHNLKIPKQWVKYDDVFAEIYKNNPELNANEIAKAASTQVGTDLGKQQVSGWAKRNKITLLTKDLQLLPEMKALDKIIKKNVDKFNSITRYGREEKSAAGLAKFLLREMRKAGYSLSPDNLASRLVRLEGIYSGRLVPGESYWLSEEYKVIKPIKDFKDSKFAKSFIATTTSSGHVGVVAKAKMLGLPDKAIALLEDITKGASVLSEVKMAGDHTDSDALMRAVLNDKNWKQYKKEFLRINMISYALNDVKKDFDRTISSAYNQKMKGIITGEEFNKIVAETKAALFKKTKIPIGNPQFVIDPKTKVETFKFNFLTERIGDLKSPRNKAILEAMNNLVKQSGVKFQGFDEKIRFANTVKEKLNFLKNATAEQLRASKYLKSFAAMSNPTGKAALEILKIANKLPGYAKIGGTVVGVNVLLSTIASAAEKDETPEPVDEKQEDRTAVFPYDIVGALAEDPKKTMALTAPIVAGAAIVKPTKALEIAKQVGTKAGSAFEKIIRPLFVPAVDIGAAFVDTPITSKEHHRDVTSPAFWMTKAFWAGAMDKYGITRTFSMLKNAPNFPEKARILRDIALRGIVLNPKAVRAVSKIAWPATAAASVYDAYKDYQERKPDIEKQKELIKEGVIKEEEFDKEEPMFAMGGIASLMK